MSTHHPYVSVWDQVLQPVKDAFKLSKALVVDYTGPLQLGDRHPCFATEEGKIADDYVSFPICDRLGRVLESYVNKYNEYIDKSTTWKPETKANVKSLLRKLTAKLNSLKPTALISYVMEEIVYGLGDPLKSLFPLLEPFLIRKAEAEGKCVLQFGYEEELCEAVDYFNDEELRIILNYLYSFLARQFRLSPDQRLLRSAGQMNLIQYNCHSPVDDPTHKGKMDAFYNMHATPGSRRDSGFLQGVYNTFKRPVEARSRLLAEEIEKMLKSRYNSRHFFVLDEKHFEGVYSIIELLQDRGLTVKKILESDEIR